MRSAIDYWARVYGVDPTLARALAWMESGFQQDVVSSVGALGVMQLLPETWEFVDAVLLGVRTPRNYQGNVRAGVRYLRWQLDEFGGNRRLALAGWYQGARAVREIGLYNETKLFVRDRARALRHRLRLSRSRAIATASQMSSESPALARGRERGRLSRRPPARARGRSSTLALRGPRPRACRRRPSSPRASGLVRVRQRMYCVEPALLLALESKRRARRSLRLVVACRSARHLGQEVQLHGAPPVEAHLRGERLSSAS